MVQRSEDIDADELIALGQCGRYRDSRLVWGGGSL